MEIKNCRACGNLLPKPFLDLGNSPLANSYETNDSFAIEFPLAVAFCTKCYLVQLTYTVDSSAMFSDYAYFSSYSTTFLKHIERYVWDLAVDIGITKDTCVLEIASNDGYLLKFMKRYTRNILGIDPAKNIAAEANKNGIPTIAKFFNSETVIQDIFPVYGKKFNIIIGNNVLAHVPDINDFIQGVSVCLEQNGVAVFEFPYLMSFLRHVEFDTIYHEHIFYYSLIALKSLFSQYDMEIFDVRFSQIHGGSIRIFVKHSYSMRPVNSSVSTFEYMERMEGLDTESRYHNFAWDVKNIKNDLLSLVEGISNSDKILAAYGAPAKGNTLLNYCGIGNTHIKFTVDLSPHKQGKYLPGSHIPILPPDELVKQMPDYCLILPWNFKEEIMNQQAEYLKKGGKFVVPIPVLRVIEK